MIFVFELSNSIMRIYFLTSIVKNVFKLFPKVLLAISLLLTSVSTANAYTKPRYSSIIIDVNNGRTLQATNATSLRYPASLTKVMTLYMLFEELEAGRVKKWTRLPVSRNATLQEPSKLYVKKGGWITVEDAIKALVVKSANDVAVVVAEYIGGTEKRFAEKMTKKARSIGMKRTTFKNASGLPNKTQLTTAKDMAILGIKIQSRFPTYFKYFKTRSFTYKGKKYASYNKLLGRYKGTDGIKTGYTRASGFNLISSVKRNGKSVVAVIIGAKSGNSRNAQMEKMLNKSIPLLVAKKAKLKTHTPKNVTKPTRPVLVTSKSNNRLTARMTPMPKTLENLTSADKVLELHKARANGTQPVITSFKGKDQSQVGKSINAILPVGYAPTVNRSGKTNLSAMGQKVIVVASAKFVKNKTAQPKPALSIASVGNDSWAVQVGAYANQTDAKNHLDKLNKIMTPYDAKYYIPSVKKGSKSIYRARFAGLSKSYAKRACTAIKREGYNCLALKNN